MTDTYTLWVCRDCMLHHANGECGSCHMDSEGTWDGHDQDPWCDVDVNDTFTMGLLDEQHDCVQDHDGSAIDCDCETRDFSWWPCGACGSTLAGERHAFTGWIGDRR